MIKTSAQAYNFACSMTGFGIETDSQRRGEEAEAEGAIHNAPKPPKHDALDYSRFDQIGCAAAAESTSEFFDLRKAAAMQGCAHDRSKERALYERPNREKLHLASRFRVDGNAHFKSRDFMRASNCYLRGLLQLEYTFPDTPEEESLFNDLKLALHLNQAAAKLNLEDYDEAAIQADHALKLDPHNAKALYRKAQSEIAWGKYDSAVRLLRESAAAAPETAGACEGSVVRALGLKHAKADRGFYRNIFEQKKS